MTRNKLNGPVGDVRMNTQLSAEQQKYIDPVLIRSILQTTKTIAMVGLSPKSERPSHFVATYLQYEGFRVIPINPRAEEILGEKAYPDLKSVPSDIKIDMVNVFRRPEDCPPLAAEAVTIGAKTIWFQLRVISQEAADIAEAGGLQVVMDRCVKIEHGRYNGSLHWVGMNTEIISARRGRKYL
ncbi:MAG: putative CoA-binding protein [Cellvibrionaceae bacterium]|jgi:predicted CoA-binding protein